MKKCLFILLFSLGLLALIPTDSKAFVVVVEGSGNITIAITTFSIIIMVLPPMVLTTKRTNTEGIKSSGAG